MYQPIENHGVIGNLRTVALVGMDGCIDWFCYPDFDSPSLFGSILDDRSGGRFSISPINGDARPKQFYWPSTNVLVTRFSDERGIVEIRDFMPLRRDGDTEDMIVRLVRCVRGSFRVRMECVPAFNYGRARHEVEICQAGARLIAPGLAMQLSSSVPVQNTDNGGVCAEFDMSHGDSALFALRENEEARAPISVDEAEAMFDETVRYWRNWLSACKYFGRWREEVQRSALLLKLLTFSPTGAIVAAPTCSLPEVIGGPRNWDYRFTWIRDAAFTVYALLRIGFTQEASSFVEWLNKFTAHAPHGEAGTHVFLTLHGKANAQEEILSHWKGYRDSAPVRIGNAAIDQYQGDIYGEAMDSLYLYNKYVSPISYEFWLRIRERIDWVCDHWQQPDNGIWEMRGQRRDFVYSRVMNWVAIDRGIRLADKRSFPANRARWIAERDRIYEEVMQRGWDPKLKSFTQYYGSGTLDASLLIMPLVFFMAPSDPRMISTLDAILKDPRDGGLVSDGLVYRYPPGTDGLEGNEGTFNLCSFWLVEALTRTGRTEPARLDHARIIFERMLGYANHLGLYAEQTGPRGEALGNFPQAFTHLALISAAFNLDRVLGDKP